MYVYIYIYIFTPLAGCDCLRLFEVVTALCASSAGDRNSSILSSSNGPPCKCKMHDMMWVVEQNVVLGYQDFAGLVSDEFY